MHPPSSPSPSEPSFSGSTWDAYHPLTNIYWAPTICQVLGYTLGSQQGIDYHRIAPHPEPQLHEGGSGRRQTPYILLICFMMSGSKKESKERKAIRSQAERAAILKKVRKASLTRYLTKRGEGGSPWGQSTLGSKNSRCRGPEAGP